MPRESSAGGHLKRWFYTTDVVEQACGDAEKEWGRTRKCIAASIANSLFAQPGRRQRAERCRAGTDIGVRTDVAAEKINRVPNFRRLS